MKRDHGTSAVISGTCPNHAERTNSDGRMKNRVTTMQQTPTSSSTMNRYSSRPSYDISKAKEFKLQELAMLSIAPIIRSIHHWWLQRAERHYLICADVELQRAREAQMNVAYYQKRAALARSARN